MEISGVRAEGRGAEGLVVSGVTGSPREGQGAFARAMRGIAREIDRGEARMAGATRLRSYDVGTLIALQVGIYRYTEAVDLASKIVDRGTNAVRTVLQGGGH